MMMQFWQALYHLLIEIICKDLALSAVYIMKAYIHDVFYHILVEPQDIPNIGLIFPIIPIIESLAVMPLVPPVG